jgi:lysophospholipase L1-like esterase
MRPGRWVTTLLLGALVTLGALVGCGGGEEPDGGDASGRSSRTAPSSADPTEVVTPRATAALDSIAVMGHSGATGTLTDPDDVTRDATENSWATGENPQVRSIYLRLAATHPAMRGHNYNVAVNGSTVDNLEAQLQHLLEVADPLPDVVIVQTIDNDIRCDGTDAENVKTFGRVLGRMLELVREKVPDVSFFLVSQWATVRTYATWAQSQPAVVAENSGTGPCAFFTPDGELRPAGIRSLQGIVDGYWGAVEKVCAVVPDCWTDRGLLQTMSVTTRDLARDFNHPSIEGHAKIARLAWQAFPAEIKQRD